MSVLLEVPCALVVGVSTGGESADLGLRRLLLLLVKVLLLGLPQELQEAAGDAAGLSSRSMGPTKLTLLNSWRLGESAAVLTLWSQ